MPFTWPPSEWSEQPRIVELPVGERLWHMHDQRLGSGTFSLPDNDNWPGGGRFDATAGDPFSTLYAGLSAEAAVAEHLVRCMPFGLAGKRVLPPIAIANRSVSALKTTRIFRLAALLTGDDLHRVAQDDWLVTAEPRDYAATREWARWLRRLAPEVQGLLWSSAHVMGVWLVVLFGDRTLPGCVEPVEPSIELDTAEGAEWLGTVLKPWGISVCRNETDLPGTGDGGRGGPTVGGEPFAEVDGGAVFLPDFRTFYFDQFRRVRSVVHAAVLDWELADDATQEAMIVAYRKWDVVAHHGNPAGYVTVTAKRIAIRVQKAEARQTSFSASDAGQRHDRDHAVADHAAGVADRQALEQALGRLSREKAGVFLLHSYYGYPLDEIARLLGGIPAGTVKSRLHAARRELQTLLGGTLGDWGDINEHR